MRSPPFSRRSLRELSELLAERRPELERATLARVYGVSDPASIEDPQYVSGLRAAVSAALAYGVSGIGGRAERPPPIPPELLAQARFAARNGVSLDTVLRRYFAGYTLLGDFVIQIAEESSILLGGAELQRLWRSEAALFDRLIATIAHEYTTEAEGRLRSAEQRRVECARRLLDGELLDASELRYEFDVWHLGAIASGPGGPAAIRELATRLDRSLLIVRPDGETVWAWLGGRERLSTAEVMSLASTGLPAEVTLAFGEPGDGIEGWRLTHRQAKAAHPVAARGTPNIVRYTDVALLATALRDEVLAGSLQDLYLAPLEREQDGGEALRQTLRAYFGAARNVSSTAATLGVSRPTVKRRLGRVEERIGRSVESCAAEIETGLHLQDLGVGSYQF